MRIPARVLVPIVAALLVAGGILTTLVLQLEDARAALLSAMRLGDESSDNAGNVMATGITGQNVPLLSLHAGDLYALRGEWAKAEEAYAKAADEEESVASLRKLLTAQLQRRKIHEARNTLDRMQRAGSREEDIDLLTSTLDLRSGELVKARTLLTAMTESPQKRYGLALLSIIQDEHANARVHLQSVIDGWDPALRTNAKILLGAYEEYDLFPESPDMHLRTLLARSLAQVYECEIALPLLSRVIQEQPDYRDAWIVQGFCELSTERFKESLSSFERAYGIDPQKPEIQYFLGRTYAALGDPQNALTFFQYALGNRFTPESEVRRYIAEMAVSLKNASLALEQYEALAISDPRLPVFEEYVHAALLLGKKEEAYLKARDAVSKWPKEAAAQELLGITAAETGRIDEARTALEAAIALDPQRESARKRLETL